MHTQIKVKCIDCGLHFVICTWNRDQWIKIPPRKIYCPECGKNDRQLIWSEDSQQEINNVVPGNALLCGLS